MALLFDEHFTSDNSPTGQIAPTRAQLAARGWLDGISSLGVGYKSEVDPALGKSVLYAHWATRTSGTGDIKQPDGEASAIKKLFPGTRDATMYAVVKFHNVGGSPQGAHWVRFFNLPTFGANSPGNADGQIDLDVSTAGGQTSWLYDPTTKQVAQNPQGDQRNGFFLYSGGSLSYATSGKSNTWKDDVWYEVVWYVKASSTGSGPQGVGDGQMRVYVRPYGTTSWVSVFDGANFVTSLRRDPISAWMIGPYQDRYANDIRHYFSRVAVWTGDAYTDGTLASFLGATPPPPTPTPVNCVLSDWSPWSAWKAVSATVEQRTRTRTVVTPPANGGTACGPLSETESRGVIVVPPDPPTIPELKAGTYTAPRGAEVAVFDQSGALTVVVRERI